MPKLGCLGIVLLALALMVISGIFFGVPTPGVHLPPGNILTADTPEHYWDGEAELEIHPHADDIESDLANEFYTTSEDDLPEGALYRWAFYADGVLEGQETGARVEHTFSGEKPYAVEVFVYESRAQMSSHEWFAAAASRQAEKSAFPITNTMIASWITVILLVSIAYFAMRKRQLVPTGLQNAFEWIVEWLLTFVENAAGRENGRRFFPVVATIFFFVIFNAYLALVPIFNVIGWGHELTYETAFFPEQTGHVVTTTLLRSANTDVNLPLALAIVSFIAVEFWGIRSVGFFSYLGKFIKVKPVLKSIAKGKPMDIFTAVMEAFVGAIEMVTEFIRLVSFTFRLFGNMTAGEVLLLMMAFLIPTVVPVLFYGLELLVGFIQAMIFAGLTLGFAMIAVMPHEEEEHH